LIKTITKVGNSLGLIFDSTLRELAGLKEGDQVNVTVHEGGSIVITPMHQTISAAEASKSARALIQRNAGLFKRLSK
jgi:antitoxin component of MazEF toxin-antitoxin module